MFTESDGSNIVLWDINKAETVDPDLFRAPTKWQIFTSETNDYNNYRRYGDNGCCLGKNSRGLLEPRPSPGWNRRYARGHVELNYTYPAWNDVDSVALGAGVTTGAIGGTFLLAPPFTSAAGGAVGGITALAVIGVTKLSNPTMRPRYQWARGATPAYGTRYHNRPNH